MRHLGMEERAALLLTTDDDDDNHEIINSPSRGENDHFPIIAKRPRTYHPRSTSSTHSVLCFILIMGAFVLGCVSGVVIMLYRISQDSGQGPASLSSSDILQKATTIDLSIQTKLIQSIATTSFMNMNRSMESEDEAANKLFKQWQTLSPLLTSVNKFSYETTLTKYAPLTEWSGIQLLDGKTEKELLKVDLLLTEEFLSFPSLIKSNTINGNSIYYVNYGRYEDFAYLLSRGIKFPPPDQSIVFMRRNRIIFSPAEQIHQAIYYGFSALVLFDDNQNPQTTTTNDRQPFFREWARLGGKDRDDFLNGVPIHTDSLTSVLILSYNDVLSIFGSLQNDSNEWLSCPIEWHNKSTPLKLGGTLSSIKLRLVVNVQANKTQFPIVMSLIRGTVDPDRFILVGFQLGSTQQNKIINEIIQAYTKQIKNGWNPKKSVLFCAWSGLDYDYYTVRRWLSDNHHFIDKNIIAYIDLGNDILGNSTLNLHGSPLLEQVAYRAANIVESPLDHNHTCHHRQMAMGTTTVATVVSNVENPHHDHGRKRRETGHEHLMKTNEQEENKCIPHKLLDEWIRASHNQMGLNQSLGIVQPIDSDSLAAVFQLQYGIPAILIEMTDEQALSNDAFYTRRSFGSFNRELQPESFVAYTQFITEIIRQLIDEPMIPFNLTNYADQIDQQANVYLAYHQQQYFEFPYLLETPSVFTKTLNTLTKSLRQIQTRIEQTSKTDYVRFQQLNNQLIEIERLFIRNVQQGGTNTLDKTFRHILIGPAFGLTKTVVPFPSLSNILFGIPGDPPTELCELTHVFWFKLKDYIYSINRILNGFDGLLTNDK